MNSLNTLQHQTQLVKQKLNSGQIPQADNHLNALINAHPHNIELWYLKSVCTFALGRYADCEFSINKVLVVDPSHIPTLMNLAQLQRKNNYFKDAVDTYIKILSIDKNHILALFYIGITLITLNQSTEAEKYLHRASLLDKQNINVLTAYGQSLQNQDKDKLALSVFNMIIDTDPLNISALNNKGLSLKKLCFWEEATINLRKAYSLAPTHTEIIKNLASCYTVQGNFTQAKELYTKALSINELDMDAHHWLNKLLWEHKDSSFLSSYKNTLIKFPTNTELLFNMGHKLNLSGEFEQAKEVLQQSLKCNNVHTPSLVELSVVLRELNELEESLEFSKLAYKNTPECTTAASEFGKSLISCDQPQRALGIFNELIIKEPYNQSWLAYKAITLKLMGSAEYDYLCNYDHVLITEISTPNGYKNLTEFNKCLLKTLRDYHHAKTNPLDQSLITGSQTSDKLFDYHIPIIQELRACFREKTIDFLSQLPKDLSHPLLRRNTLDFTETDSWSVILHNTGFHKNHYHPAGWYSGPYYAQIPSIVSQSESKEGWIKLGQPGFNMMTKLQPDILLEPKEGMLVKFPSYFWHGTVPFTSEQERITVQADIIPL